MKLFRVELGRHAHFWTENEQRARAAAREGSIEHRAKTVVRFFEVTGGLNPNEVVRALNGNYELQTLARYYYGKEIVERAEFDGLPGDVKVATAEP
jgi:hypothetical protein